MYAKTSYERIKLSISYLTLLAYVRNVTCNVLRWRDKNIFLDWETVHLQSDNMELRDTFIWLAWLVKLAANIWHTQTNYALISNVEHFQATIHDHDLFLHPKPSGYCYDRTFTCSNEIVACNFKEKFSHCNSKYDRKHCNK